MNPTRGNPYEPSRAEDEATRQRLASENLARASRNAERDSNPIPLSREPRQLPKPEPLWMAQPAPTHAGFEALQRRRWFRWGAAIAAFLIGALFAWLVSR